MRVSKVKVFNSNIREEDFETYASERIPQYVVNRENGIRKVIVYSHPVLLPKAIDPWVFATCVDMPE